MLRYSTLLLLLAFPVFVDAQAFRFRKYSEQEGLNNKFVYTIDQDELGNLLVGTGEGLYTYDGFNFNELSTENGLGDNFITCSMRAADGAIWYGHNQGVITKYVDGKFEVHDISKYTQSRINQIAEDDAQQLWVLTQNDGLLRLEKDGSWKQFVQGVEDLTIYAFNIDKWKNIWLGTDMGLLRAQTKGDNALDYEFIDEVIETKVSSIVRSEKKLVIGTDDSGIFEITPTEAGYEVKRLTYKETDFARVSVNSLYIDPEKNLWICSNNNGLIQLSGLINGQYLKMTNYSETDAASTPSLKICTTDREGNMWIGTMGDGLIRLVDNYFSVFTYENESKDNGVFSVFEKNDTTWTGGISTINVSYIEPSNIIQKYSAIDGLPDGPITAIFLDGQKTLWVGTDAGGLLVRKAASKKFEQIALGDGNPNQRINDILGYMDGMYVATDFGIYYFVQDKLVSHISVQSGLSHNVVKSLYKDIKGRIWIGTHNSQLTYIENGIIRNMSSPLDDALIQIKCIAEDNNGDIWVGSDGMGVLKISGDDIVMFNKASGLYSDYCYSIICDHRNKLWVGHHGAVSQINLLNNHIEIIDPGSGFNIDFSDNATDKTPAGVLLFGINEGLLRYEPDKDQKNENEPILHFESITINDSVYKWKPEIRLPYGNYKLALDFIGVSLKNPSKVTYQYMLEGYDFDWSDPTTSSFVNYNKLGPGEYKFRIKSFNSDDFGGTEIREFTLFIDKPFWLKWWFIITCIVSLIMIVRYIILRRERYLRENQERLKHALDERTKEVVEQKELLEVKNKDITDSIQYARNIQKAMLPALDSLNNFFADSFVYYKPRDIVSGDFYWVERFENTVVVSCADCTGHGVPGAFMSLIGSTLLKEVSNKKIVQCSRDVLIHLHSELGRMLNKQGDAVTIEDGMDIVVFDYNVDTKKIRMASANRPIIFFNNGEWLELRGDRQSIGGSTTNSDTVFNQYEFDIYPGDMIYLFSDGITDQFGGRFGKKLKRSGLISWIKSVSHLPMNDQRRIIRDEFYQWKGDSDQIDDIIVIGIKF